MTQTWTQEDESDAGDDFDGCEHGIGFDEDCEDCDDDPMECAFPSRCLMPGIHCESECHTTEMMEEIMKTPTEWQNLNKGVQVIHIGQGKVVSNFGTHFGVPCVFIEPVSGDAGEVGQKVEEGREPHITSDSVSDGGILLVLHGREGADVLVEDIRAALDRCGK